MIIGDEVEIHVIGKPIEEEDRMSYSIRIANPEDLTLRDAATALREAASMLDEMIRRGIGT